MVRPPQRCPRGHPFASGSDARRNVPLLDLLNNAYGTVNAAGRNEMARDECDARDASKRPVVFITGANGFIGRALGAYFGDKGFAVRGVDRGADPARFVVAGDIVDPSPWQAQVQGCAVVVHTAAVVSNAVPAVQQWQNNVLGTRRVIEAAARAKVGRVVHLSSVRAYGDLGFPDTVEESWPLRPDGHAYVDTKVASEAVAFQAHAAGEVAVTIVRPGDVYWSGVATVDDHPR